MGLFTICASSHGSGSCIPPGSGAEELPLPAAAEGLGLVMSFLPVSLSVSSSCSVPARAAAAHPIRYRHFALVPGHQCRAGRLHACSCTRAGTGANGTGRADIVAGSRLLVQQLLAVRHPSPIREKGPRRARRNRSNLQPGRAREQKSCAGTRASAAGQVTRYSTRALRLTTLSTIHLLQTLAACVHGPARTLPTNIL